MDLVQESLIKLLLTHQLMDLLNQSPSPRIINVSSSAHYGREITFDDLNRNENYSGFRVYGETKLANVMFTYSLARKVKSTMTVNALHPGFVATGFASNNGFLYKIGMILMRPLQMSTKKGAKTQIYLASSPKVDNTTGKFFIKKKERSSSRYSNEKEHQKRLWDISEELTNL
ncbi:MAG: SDR family NAD(P)-dependent oxidoreductase [Candidatus Heimdallarchaeota archaeon]|nr:SDR family NAD(P)-dependent oxidoreductase [Candidatus Heimdallarchaeota archaeon]